MITEAEARRTAAKLRVDPMVVDLDYSLGWFLLGLSNHSGLRDCLRFKGGTCLRKCFFPDYRFSEDLDFTMEVFISKSQLESGIQQIARWVIERNGPNFLIEPIKVEVVNDEYGSESYQARIYYRGPLQWGGSPRTIRIDTTRHEVLLLPAVYRPIHHPYSDQNIFQASALVCYSLEEVLAEKLRAIGGQRRFAISRDLYDICNLRKAGADLQAVRSILPKKFQARGIAIPLEAVRLLESRKGEFLQDWNRRLSYLIQSDQSDFESAWDTVVDVLRIVVG